MTTPNEKQQELIENTDGIYVVDAGAGTGKTFTVTRRYANIVAQDDVEPDDVLLVTFTNNAATEMKDRIVSHCEYGMRELADAPIQTFHSLCYDILTEHGFEAPKLLGIDDRITGSTRVLEDETVEQTLFEEFIRQFSDRHEEYDDIFRAVTNPTGLLGLINQLAAKGVFPTATGWYRNGERHLDGDFEAFEGLFEELNEPRNGGSKQSRLRSKLGRYGSTKFYRSDAPAKHEIRGSRGEKQVPPAVAEEVFNEDRAELKRFVHDVYFEYLHFALRRNYLNFGFLQLFAFVLLCDDHELREEIAYEYVMVDEFQDSSEIQFKLALLLARTDNICVVGDWKQSIYSFQYAAVENITEFRPRLARFAKELNEDSERIAWSTDAITELELTENYRSTQAILEFSEESLITPAASKDEVDVAAVQDRIVSLSSNATYENSRIEALYHEDEYEAVLTKIQEIVGNEGYQIEEEGELRCPTYGDIAVLTRTRAFGRELLSTAEEYQLPIAYEGGIEVFRSDPAKLLLAWLRIVESNSDRGWAVVLETAGYTLDEVDYILDNEAYPASMQTFRERLKEFETVGAFSQCVFSRYDYEGPQIEVLLTTIESVHNSTTLTRGGLIAFIERGIENGAAHDVHARAGVDSVTVQTIHAAKGLEYPIVILANMNSHRFPPSGGSDGVISFTDPVGLRQRKCYGEDHGHPHIYDNWQTDVVRTCLPREYDEERRLLYVAMTRAKSHLIFAAGADPNTFIQELPVDLKELEPAVQAEQQTNSSQAHLDISIPPIEGPASHSPHSLMRDDVFEDVDEGRGIEFGTETHEFAERYARGESVAPTTDDEHHIKAFIDALDGELRVEENAYLPLTVEGEQVTISGIVDLVHIRPESVEIVDFKTDLSRHAETEYRKQLSVYYHVLAGWFEDRDVSATIFYTAKGETVNIEPLTESELVEITKEAMDKEQPP